MVAFSLEVTTTSASGGSDSGDHHHYLVVGADVQPTLVRFKKTGRGDGRREAGAADESIGRLILPDKEAVLGPRRRQRRPVVPGGPARIPPTRAEATMMLLSANR